MKSLACLLLLVAALPAAAQQTEITKFGPTELIWTNEMTNVFCSLMFTWDLDHMWHPVPGNTTWNRRVTNHLMQIDQPLEFFMNISGGGDSTFLQLRSAVAEMEPPQTTNLLRFVNSSAQPVTNVFLELNSNLEGQSISILMLPPSTTSAWYALVFEDIVSIPTGVVPLVEQDLGRIHGGYWRTNYWQDVEFMFEYFGPPQNRRTAEIQADGWTLK